MQYLGLLVISSCVLLAFGQQLTNCSTLDIGRRTNLTTTPVAGSSLRICRTDRLQCCSDAYFDNQAEDLRHNQLMEGLREQLRDHQEDLTNIQVALRSYVTNTFLRQFHSTLPSGIGANLSDLNPVITELQDYFYIRPRAPGERNFSVVEFTETLIHSLAAISVRNIEQGFEPFNETQRMCLQNLLRQRYINQTAVQRYQRSLKAFRRSINSLNRIAIWYNNTFLHNLNRYFNPLDACINAFILARCEACVRNIPPLCRGVCNAITYGCYAVFENGLRGQFNVLWNVTNQLVNITRDSVADLVMSGRRLSTFDGTNTSELFSLALQARQMCGVTPRQNPSIPSGRRRRQTRENTIPIPDSVRNSASRLERSGAFSYDGDEGPEFCEGYTNRNCWNSSAVVANFTNRFINTTIEGQRNNPYLQVNVADLQAEVQRIGNPVTDYLNGQEFQEVAPEALTIPEDNNPSDNSSGYIAFSSLVMVLISAIIVSLF